jgi:DNA-binding transcriptional MocR family regulator
MTDEGGTRVGGVMRAINGRIASRSLSRGAKLPSIRALASSMRVSKSTVVDAYDRLAAEGVIRSRPGSGFYVAAPLAPLSLADVGPKLDRVIDPLWISRQSLAAPDGVLIPGCGWLPSSWMPETLLRRAMRRLSRSDDAVLTDYAPPQGLPPLRHLLARRLGEQGIETSAERIILTESGTQSIDLLCRFLIEPGDTVLVDDPCYFNFHALLRAHRARAVSVPYTPSGPDVDVFARVLSEHKPRLYITNSAVHNPTGATLSPVVAHRVLKLAEQAGLNVVEDDIFADFERAPVAKLAAFDGLDRVVHIGSFSKTLSASVRCGYIAARADWIEGLTDLKIATTFGGGTLAAALVFDVLKDSGYRRHVESLRLRLQRSMEETAGRLRAIGIMPWVMPQAGMFLWCRLPDGIDAARVSRRALDNGVVLAPGNAFSLSQAASGYLRFNVAQSADERIFQALEAAMAGP